MIKLLGYGMKCALPPQYSFQTYTDELQRFRRTLNLNDHFTRKKDKKDKEREEEEEDPSPLDKFRLINNWWPDGEEPFYISQYCDDVLTDFKALIPKVKHTINALSKTQIKTIREFAHKDNLIIQNADKGLGLTVINRSWYDAKGADIVKTYTHIDHKEAYRLLTIANNHLKTCCLLALKLGAIKPKLIQYITHINIDNAKFPLLYLMPKLHKQPIGVRPIVADHSSILTNTAKVSGFFFSELYSDSEVIITDTRRFINEIESLRVNHPNCILATADITNLYGEIPINHLIDIIRTAEMRPLAVGTPLKQLQYTRLIRFMKKITEIALKNNFLQFNGQIYHQHTGVAMGSALGPTMANVYLHTRVDQTLLDKPEVLYVRRYLDDVFFVLRENTDIREFQNSLNRIDAPFMRFTLESDLSMVNFLDLFVYKSKDGTFKVKNYVKPNNKFLYIPYKSFHTDTVKKGFIKTELMRLVKNSSTITHYKDAAYKFQRYLLARGYPILFLYECFIQVKYSSRQQLLTPKPKQTHVYDPKDPNNHQKFFYVSHLDSATRNKTVQNIIRKYDYWLNYSIDNIQDFAGNVHVALRKSPTIYNLVTKNRAPITVKPPAPEPESEDVNEVNPLLNIQEYVNDEI